MLIIPDIFSPYVEGTEIARKANWDDINNYNTEQRNQLSNLFDLATLSPRINNEYEKTDSAALANLFNETTFDNRVSRDNMDTQLGQYAVNKGYYNDQLYGAAFPGRYAEQSALSTRRQQYADPLAQLTIQAREAQLRNALLQQQYSNQVLQNQQKGITTPSGMSNQATNGSLVQPTNSIPAIQNPNKPLGNASMGQLNPSSNIRPSTTQTPIAATAVGNSALGSTPLAPMTPAQQRQAQVDSARNLQITKLAEMGIIPHTRTAVTIPGFKPDSNIFTGNDYSMASNLDPRDILPGILDLPRYSYETPEQRQERELQEHQLSMYAGRTGMTNTSRRRPILDNPDQEYTRMPLEALQEYGITADALKAMYNGSSIIGNNNMIVSRDQPGRYWATPLNRTTGTLSEIIPIDSSLLNTAQKQ